MYGTVENNNALEEAGIRPESNEQTENLGRIPRSSGQRLAWVALLSLATALEGEL